MPHGDMGPKQVADVGDKLFGLAQMTVKAKAIELAKEMSDNNNGTGAYLGTMMALGAMVPAAMVYAKKPDNAREIQKSGDHDAARKLMYALVNPRTLMFTALVTARTLSSISADTTETAYGPSVMAEAMEDWKLIFPHSKPEDVFEPAVMEAIAEISKGSNLPLDEFLAKQKRSLPPPATLQ